MIHWTPIQGTEGLSVTAFAVGPSQSAPFSLAASTSGLLVSTDNCRTWQKHPGKLADIPVLAACLSPGYESDSLVFLGAAGGIAYTHNLMTLHASRMPQAGINVVSLAVSPNFAEDGILLAGSLDYGILQSTDRGKSWKERHYGLQDLTVLALGISPDFARDKLALSGTSTAIFRTPNGGLAWREANLPCEEAVLSITFSSYYPEDPRIFAGTEGGRLFVSQDAGRTWEIFYIFESALSINALVSLTHPISGSLLAAGVGSSIYLTANSDAHWENQEFSRDILSLASGHEQNGIPFILAGVQDEGIWLGEYF
jgi:photosystem II stability/assembly factor-like uncharacterized protein